ncbi:hypothetical protein L6164_017993 [Bauhinia variegata]|uniref:Uncharacterized protein n=1 Tax=Bauhinia variegata TaxID=167791 RepID=A0ACB9NB47_BAUVA|nr:hypothetical protein L6164_017993 [Bauhinia variegata]
MGAYGMAFIVERISSSLHNSLAVYFSNAVLSLRRRFTMAPVATFKALAIVLVVTLFSVAVSAQELSPAPAPDAGSAGSVSSSVAMIGASVVLSMLAILKQ